MSGDDNVMFGFYQSNRFTIAGITGSFLVYNWGVCLVVFIKYSLPNYQRFELQLRRRTQLASKKISKSKKIVCEQDFKISRINLVHPIIRVIVFKSEVNYANKRFQRAGFRRAVV
jgi:hypothetical protein